MQRIRPEQPDDTQSLRTEICRQCWLASYVHLLGVDVIDLVFDGMQPLTGSWLTRRTKLLGRSYAEVDGVTVGFVEVGELTRPRSGEVVALYVLPEFQRRGLGRQLWDEGCRLLAASGHQTVEVWAVSDADALEFYKAIGCEAVSTGFMGVGDHKLDVTGLVTPLVTPLRKSY
jgi:ribosomal protein S18 acetylase RimI-like enzyme